MRPAISIMSIDHLDATVESYQWIYARTNEAEIARHWEGLCARQPSLFNGPVLLMHRWQQEDPSAGSVFRTGHFVTEFRSFIAWRDSGFNDTSVRNCFSMAALQGADGAFVLGVMGEHTSNAGQIYFPAGTPDTGDIAGERLDLAGSAVRELAEETGLDTGTLSIADGWSVVDAGPRLACMKVMRAAEDAASVADRIERWNRRQSRPELSGVHAVSKRADILPARMPDFMIAWLKAQLPPE